MLALTDDQLRLIWDAVASLDSEADRAQLLQLIGDQVRVRTCDLQDAIDRALKELEASRKPKYNRLTLPANCLDATSESSGKKWGDLTLPANFKVVMDPGTIHAFVGPPYRPRKS